MACLAVMKDTGISVNQLIKILYWIKDVQKRQGHLQNIPTAAAILKKKKDLIPEGVTSTQEGAKVSMVNVFNHTAERSMSRPDIGDKMSDNTSYEYIWKAGSDSQSGMGKINRNSQHDPDVSFNVGAQLLLIRKKDDPNNVVFENTDSGGIRLYRPLEKSSSKETDEKIVQTYDNLRKEESVLKEKQFTTTDGKSVKVHHKVIISMLDGKSRRAITENLIKKRRDLGLKDKEHGNINKLDNNTCLLCLVPPKNHHKKETLKRQIKFPELLGLGISPLHLKIKVMEYIFTGAVNKKALCDGYTKDAAKKYLQQKFLTKEGGGLRLYIPEPQKGGNSNTGVIANRFFMSKTSAGILGVSQALLDSSWKLLKMINETKSMIDCEEYEAEANKCFDLYIRELGK